MLNLLFAAFQRLRQIDRPHLQSRLSSLRKTKHRTRTHVLTLRSMPRPPLALRVFFGNAPHHSILLFWRGKDRFAELLKSPRLAPKTVPFSVAGVGIRDTQASAAAAASARTSSCRGAAEVTAGGEAVRPAKRASCSSPGQSGGEQNPSKRHEGSSHTE